MEIAKRIDPIENQYEQDSAAIETSRNVNSQTFLQASMRASQSFSEILPEAKILYDELLSRVPPEVAKEASPGPKMNYEAETTKHVMETGSLAGAYPLKAASDYLRRLAILLPQDAAPKGPRKR